MLPISAPSRPTPMRTSVALVPSSLDATRCSVSILLAGREPNIDANVMVTDGPGPATIYSDSNCPA